MFRIAIVLCACLFVGSSNAQELAALEEGDYLLHGRNGPSKPFTVSRGEQKWEVNSVDPAFPTRLIQCMSSCDFRTMSENAQLTSFPQLIRQFEMSCIANSAFALCKMMTRAPRDCRSGPLKQGEVCTIGPQPRGKPIYGLFALFAPGVMPISVTRVAAE